MDEKVLCVKNLTKIFKIKSKKLFESPKDLIAVNDVSFDVYKNETFGVIGESGSGKSTLGKCIGKMTNITSGDVEVFGESILLQDKNRSKEFRKNLQMIFQDPYSSLNPRKTAGYMVEEPLIIHGIGNQYERKKRVKEIFELVGLTEAHSIRYPHEFSGGQRQRICIARALVLDPKIIIADEPVSALDVSVQSQVINLLKEIQRTLGITYLFISHDLSVVKYISHRVGIMYLGKIIEIGNSETLYKNPLHPYTKSLLSAIPKESPFEKEQVIKLEGEIPSPLNLPKGCAFSTRCPYAFNKCFTERPELLDSNGINQKVACFLYNDKRR